MYLCFGDFKTDMALFNLSPARAILRFELGGACRVVDSFRYGSKLNKIWKNFSEPGSRGSLCLYPVNLGTAPEEKCHNSNRH